MAAAATVSRTTRRARAPPPRFDAAPATQTRRAARSARCCNDPRSLRCVRCGVQVVPAERCSRDLVVMRHHLAYWNRQLRAMQSC